MGGSAKAPTQSDASKEAEKLSIELMKEQLRLARMPVQLPELNLPPPPPPPPPPAMTVSADVAEAEEAARRAAARRVNATRGTLFAGETGGYKSKTLLG